MSKFIGAIVALLLIISGGYFYNQNRSAASTKTIRIGLNPWPGYEFFYLAEKKGFFTKMGVNAKVIEYNSLEDVRHGFEKGQIDIMNSTIIELLLSEERSQKKPKAFFISDFSNGGDVIIANKNIANIKQLKGKKIAVEPNSLGLYMLSRALQKNNMSLKDITMVGMTQLNMEKVMNDDTIAAIVSYPPVSINVMRDIKGTHKIFTSADIPGEIIDIASAEESFLNNRSADVKKIIQAWDMAVAFHKINPDEANQIMAEREQISAAEFAEVLGDMRILTSKEQKQYFASGGPVEVAIEEASAILVESGYVRKKIMGKKMLKPVFVEAN